VVHAIIVGTLSYTGYDSYQSEFGRHFLPPIDLVKLVSQLGSVQLPPRVALSKMLYPFQSLHLSENFLHCLLHAFFVPLEDSLELGGHVVL